MKKILNIITCLVLLLMGFSSFAQKLTKDERIKVLDHLKSTQDELMKTIKGLSEGQLNFYPSEGVWSIAQCVEHLAISETSIFGIVQMTLQSEPNSALRDSVVMSDDQILGIITSREQKVKTRPEFEPTGKFESYEGSLKEFNSKRESSIAYVKSTKDDLRNRYFDFPFGKLDAYQVILFMSGHTTRHTDQIKELMAMEKFPDQ